MSSSEILQADSPVAIRAAARRSFLLMFCCTIIGAGAQMLIKLGTAQLGARITLSQLAHDPSLFVKFCMGVIGQPKLFFGYSCYAINVVLIALALKGRELSRLYPVIALTYVWVTILSLAFLPGEHMNAFKTAGIVAIVCGVSVLGIKK